MGKEVKRQGENFLGPGAASGVFATLRGRIFGIFGGKEKNIGGNGEFY